MRPYIIFSMNRRKAKVIRLGESFVAVLPRDWVRGHELDAGDELDVQYDGVVKFSVSKAKEGEGHD